MERQAVLDRFGSSIEPPTEASMVGDHRNQKVAWYPGAGFASLDRDQYTIAWICPLLIELTAARAMLDRVHLPVAQLEGDNNEYILGNIAQHNVVIACLARSGTHAAGRVSHGLRMAFPAVQSWFLVGIGGGVPSTLHDLRLGDVVIGKTVIPYDPKKQYQMSVLRTARRTYAPDRLLSVANNMISQHEQMQYRNDPLPLSQILQERQESLAGYERPDAPDKLFDAGYVHGGIRDTTLRSYVPGPPPDPCQDCDDRYLIHRAPRGNGIHPIVKIGDIASGDTLLRSSKVREELGREELQVACFEMEAAGLDQELPCLVVRGICDYSDSHKNDEWQRYAAATAAACTRQLLLMMQPWPGRQFQDTASNEKHERVCRQREILDSIRTDYLEDGHRRFVKDTHGETCEWLLNHRDFKEWAESSPESVNKSQGLLWLKGNPGTGKSTIMKFAYEAHKKMPRNDSKDATRKIFVSFFFKAGHHQVAESALGMYRGLLVQIFEQLPELQNLLLDPDLIPSHGPFPLPVLKKIFASVVSHLGGNHLVCYLDALDECNQVEARDVIEHLQVIAKTPREGVFQALCSSRHYRSLSSETGTVLNLDELPGHTEDLRIFIAERLQVKDVAGLKELLLRKSKGIFLWVVLVVNILNENAEEGISSNVDELEEELPDELYDLFLLILKRDPPKSQRVQSKLRPAKANWDEFETVVTWIMYGRGEMSAEEFPHALISGLAVKQGHRDLQKQDMTEWPLEKVEKRVTSATKGLAQVKSHSIRGYSEEMTVQFIHESVRTFFRDGKLHEDQQLGPLLRHNAFDTPGVCHERLKKSCLWYITCPSIQASIDEYVRSCKEEQSEGRVTVSREKWKGLRRAYPFWSYAMEIVLTHAALAAPYVSQKETMMRLNEPFWEKTEAAYLGPAAVTQLEQPFYPFHVLHHICMEGHFELLTCGAFDPHCLTKEILNSLSFFGCTAAYTAAERGRTAIVEILSSWGADLDIPSNEDENQTPLMAALQAGQEEAAQFLIDHGADVHFISEGGYTACHRAVEGSCLSALQRLLARRVDIHAKSVEGYSPLLLACQGLDTKAADLLLGAGADANSPTLEGITPLMMAAANGSSEVFHALMTCNPDVNVTNLRGKTALYYAKLSAIDSKAKVCMLLEQGGLPGGIEYRDFETGVTDSDGQGSVS